MVRMLRRHAMAHDWASDRNTIHDGVFLLRALAFLVRSVGAAGLATSQIWKPLKLPTKAWSPATFHSCSAIQTVNIQGKTMTPQKLRENLVVVALSQSKLRETVEGLVGRMNSRLVVSDPSFKKIAELPSFARAGGRVSR